jgi:hypothetical protein
MAAVTRPSEPSTVGGGAVPRRFELLLRALSIRLSFRILASQWCAIVKTSFHGGWRFWDH